MNMHESNRLHPALRRALDATRPRAADEAALRPLGVEALDRALGGGIMAGALHEIFAQAEDSRTHEASAIGFAVMLALRIMAGQGGALLWLREEAVARRERLYGPGLMDLGLDPARLILGVLPDARALLRAGVDALRCTGGLGAVIIEMAGNPALMDLTASRRLALAAEASGVTPLILRLKRGKPLPSAAQTRWAVAPAPSPPLEAMAPGPPALTAALLRQRGGLAGLSWDLEWDREQLCFRPAALPGARLPLSGGGPVSPDQRADAPGWRLAG